MPISILISVGSRDVDCRSETYIDGFYGPVELAE